jgi:hypothetical protein
VCCDAQRLQRECAVLFGGNTYREGCAPSSASERDWPDEPATECDRCSRWGKEVLKDSRKSSFGFFVDLNGGQSGWPKYQSSP